MSAISIHRHRAAVDLMPWLVPAGLSVAVAVATTLLSLAPSAEPAPVAVAPTPTAGPPPVWQPDASAVDWAQVEAAPDASPLSVAAYAHEP